MTNVIMFSLGAMFGVMVMSFLLINENNSIDDEEQKKYVNDYRKRKKHE